MLQFALNYLAEKNSGTANHCITVDLGEFFVSTFGRIGILLKMILLCCYLFNLGGILFQIKNYYIYIHLYLSFI